MLALCLTFLAAVFFLGPDLIARRILSWIVPRKSLVQTRGEEIVSALLWAVIPLALAIFWFNSAHLMSRWGSSADLHEIAAGLYSSSHFDHHEAEFFQSLPRVLGMLRSLLWRLYFLVVCFALVLNFVIWKYRSIRHWLRFGWLRWMLNVLILPRISEWHVLLSDMQVPADVALSVDVLTGHGILYQGAVQDKILDNQGKLQTLTLADPRRFRREDFQRAREQGKEPRSEDYWRPIQESCSC